MKHEYFEPMTHDGQPRASYTIPGLASKINEVHHSEPTTDINSLTPIWPDKPQGRKDDAGKPAMHLIPYSWLALPARVLEFGTRKYAPRNWERGMNWSRPYGALLRHVFAWWCGQKADPETGMSHLWHAACCLMFLIEYEHKNTGTDDRPGRAMTDHEPTQTQV